AVFGTWPSTYQMLPRARHETVVTAGTRDAIDPFDPSLWIRAGFGLADPEQDDVLQALLPDVEDAAARRRIALDTLEHHLNRAERFQAALDQAAAPPAGTELHLVTSDSLDTPSRIAVDFEASSVQTVGSRPGDGLVLRSSALLDERIGQAAWQPKVRSPIEWSSVMFFTGKHFQLTRDPQFTNNLLYRLLEEPRRRIAPGVPLPTALEAPGSATLTAEAIIEALDLRPHPEGGYFSRTYRAPRDLPVELLGDEYNGPRPMGTAIYYLLVPDTFSELHRLDSDEIWHHYAGDAVEQLQLDPATGDATVLRIGRDLDAGERPQLLVRRGVWQGTRIVPDGPHGWALMGTTMAPGFDFDGFVAGTRAELIERWPEQRDRIEALTRR
ncbi:MAG: cupin domain-containing protein, partial [Acidobacteriota bacterium]